MRKIQKKGREYYEAILIDFGSIEIEHHYDVRDKNRITYSKVKIINVITQLKWGHRLYLLMILSAYPPKSTYSYNNYQEAWYHTFYLRNF